MSNACYELHKAVEAALGEPISGVCMADSRDRSTWSVRFRNPPTEKQQEAADDVLATFDPDNLPPPPPTLEDIVKDLAAAVSDSGVELPDSAKYLLRRR